MKADNVLIRARSTLALIPRMYMRLSSGRETVRTVRTRIVFVTLVDDDWDVKGS